MKTNKNKQTGLKPLHIAFIAIGAVIAILLVIVIFMLAENNRLRRSEISENPQAEENTPPEDDTENPAVDISGDNDSQDKADNEASPSPAALDSDYILSYSVTSSWESGSSKMCTVEFVISNNSDTGIKDWSLVLEIEGLLDVQGWNGNYKVKKDKLTITNAEYNGEIPAGGTVNTGCNLTTSKPLSIKSAELNKNPCALNNGAAPEKDGQDKEDSREDKTDNSGNTTDNAEAMLERPKDAVQGDDWLHTDGNKILDKDGKQVWITGVNWFGYNTGTNTFDGLWASKLETTVQAIADHGFNLIRVPISAQLINQWASGEYPRANYNNAYNPALNDMNSLEIFDYFLTLAETAGIKVMPDIHSAETDAAGHNVNLWYTSNVSVQEYYSALEWLTGRYKNNDTIIAIDLKNEPHGKPNEGKNAAIWNNSKDANNWKYVAETAASKVLAKNPNLLIMIEGTEIYPKNNKGDYSSTNSEDYYFGWWGGNLRAVKDFPINLGKYQDKLVYSPHDYGPTVYEQPWFKGNYTYDSLMKDCWRDNWFYIYENNTAPLHIGEWGGFMREPNLTWMTYMRKLIKTYHLNHTFWCLNANSGDTGGLLLDDFTTWDNEKYNFVKSVLWQENGKFVGLDHAIPLGKKGITAKAAKGV